MKRSTALRTARLGTTPFEITRVGLGAWAIGGGDWPGGWGPQDQAASIATIHRAIEQGVNWIDTAPAYGFGRSEETIGVALSSYSEADRPLVFTKCGLVWPSNERALSNDLSPASIRRECEQSLERLGVEVIDLLQAHWPTWDDTPLSASWETMAALVDEGKVRHIGLSNFGPEDLALCEAIRHVDTYQPELNMFSRSSTAALSWCAESGTGVLAYSPMRSGLLSGRFDAQRAASLPADDWRSRCDDFCEPKLTANLAVVESLREIATAIGMTLPELAIAWTLAWPAVSGAIVGARTAEQVDDWVGAGERDLDDEVLDRIADVLVGVGEGPARPDPVLA